MLSDAYVAGVFDAVGAVGISCSTTSQGRVRHTLTVSFISKKPELLALLQQEFGGSIRPIRRTTAAHLLICSQKAQHVLEMIQDHVLTKQEQIAIALQFAATSHRRGGTDAVSPEKLALREEYRDMLRAEQKRA